MSKIGEKPILIPDGVEVNVTGQDVRVKGPKGELGRSIPEELAVELHGDTIRLTPRRSTKETAERWGLFRQLIANMIEGVEKGFEKTLEIEGIGYRAVIQGEKLVFELGFSHPVEFTAPPGIAVSIEKNIIRVSGADKELVGRVAAEIRALKPPEPYKGKGIHYRGERIRRKAGKKLAGTTT